MRSRVSVGQEPDPDSTHPGPPSSVPLPLLLYPFFFISWLHAISVSPISWVPPENKRDDWLFFPLRGFLKFSPQVATIHSKDSQLLAENRETYYRAPYLLHKHPGPLLPNPFSKAALRCLFLKYQIHTKLIFS